MIQPIYISLFERCDAPIGTPPIASDIGFLELHHAVQHGIIRDYDFLPIIHNLRNAIELHGEDSTQAKAIKRKLPAVTISGTFTQRNADGIKRRSHHIVLDVDGKDQNASFNVHDTINEMKSFRQYIRMVCISPSGKGIKIIAHHHPKLNHLDAYNGLSDDIEKRFNVKIDRGGKDISRLMFLSYDENAWCDVDAVNFCNAPYGDLSKQPAIFEMPIEINAPIDYEQEKFKATSIITATHPTVPITAKKTAKDKLKLLALCDEVEKHGIDMTAKYEDWTQIALGLACTFGEDGRAAFHTISMNYPTYDANENDEKYTNAIQSHNGSLTFNTVLEIAKRHGITYKQHEIISKHAEVSPSGEFWSANKNGKVKIDIAKMYRYLESHGVCMMKLKGNPNPILVQIHQNVCEEINEHHLKVIIKKHIDSLDVSRDLKDAIHNAASIGASEKYGEKKWALHFNVIHEPEFMRDSIKTAYIYYEHAIACIDHDTIKMIPYSDAPAFVWRKWILKRRPIVMARDDYFKHDFYRLMEIVCTPLDSNAVDGERFNALRWAMGTLCHNPLTSLNKTIIHFCEANTDDGSEGRTCKTVLSKKAIGFIRKVDMVGNRAKGVKSSAFPYQNISQDTQVLHYGDVDKKYLVNGFAEDIFESVTDGMHIEKKNQHPIWIPSESLPRMVSTGNSVPQTSDASSRDRIFLMELYPQFSDHKKPVDVFGRSFFEHEWNAEDWSAFDNALWECIQYAIAHPQRPEYKSKTLVFNQFKTNTHPAWHNFIIEWFVEMPMQFKGHAKCQRYKPHPDAVLVNAVCSNDLYVGFTDWCNGLKAKHDGVRVNDMGRFMAMSPEMMAMEFPEYEWEYKSAKMSDAHGAKVHMLWKTPIVKNPVKN